MPPSVHVIRTAVHLPAKPYCRQPSPASGAECLGHSRPALTPGSIPALDLVTCFTLKWSCLARHARRSHLSSPSATPGSSSLFRKSLNRVRGDVVTLESAFYLAGKGRMSCHSLRRVPSPTQLLQEQEHMWKSQSDCLKCCRGKVFMGNPVSRSKG